jgi:hypothetical protein
VDTSTTIGTSLVVDSGIADRIYDIDLRYGSPPSPLSLINRWILALTIDLADRVLPY